MTTDAEAAGAAAVAAEVGAATATAAAVVVLAAAAVVVLAAAAVVVLAAAAVVVLAAAALAATVSCNLDDAGTLDIGFAVRRSNAESHCNRELKNAATKNAEHSRQTGYDTLSKTVNNKV